MVGDTVGAIIVLLSNIQNIPWGKENLEFGPHSFLFEKSFYRQTAHQSLIYPLRSVGGSLEIAPSSNCPI